MRHRTRERSVREVLFVAGEASGDLHASGVAVELRRTRPDLALTGIGGERMESAGVHLIERAERLAVMGFAEVLKHVPLHFALMRQLGQRIKSGRVATIVLIDYPGFNMKVAAIAARVGVPVLYYITPQVWAWGAGRLAKMARIVTRAAVILPFEEPLLPMHRHNGHARLAVVQVQRDRVEDHRRLSSREILGRAFLNLGIAFLQDLEKRDRHLVARDP